MKLLLVVDVQNDFCPGGTLAAPNGDEVVPVINSVSPNYDWVVFTQDWHPPDHGSFASQHLGKQPFEMGELGGKPQMLWPDHCVWGTHGAMFHPDLHLPNNSLFAKKGQDRAIDCYSAFYDSKGNATSMYAELRAVGNIGVVDCLDICGLTTDYCVKETVLDGLVFHKRVRVLSKAVRAVDPNTTALDEMRAAGAEIVQ